jgi:hypothetical protein
LFFQEVAPRENFSPSPHVSINLMKSKIFLVAGLFLIAAAIALSRDQRANLLPKLQSGQSLTYLIRYRAEKNVKTESSVAVPLAPDSSQMDAHGMLRIKILDLQQAGGKPAIRARGQFLTLDSGIGEKKPADEKPSPQQQPTGPVGRSIEFTILPDGSTEKINGLDVLSLEQQQIWQEWVARFAVGWTLSPERAKIGDKWKGEQLEQSASPIAALIWARDSRYVRNEPCRPTHLSTTGEVSPSSGLADECAVLLTAAKLVQKSSAKDATPETFKLRELKTMGTAKGTNEIITYISLTTGLVVRATEEAHQQMDVIVAKADGSNRVHYNVDATSHSEVLLLTEAPPAHP